MATYGITPTGFVLKPLDVILQEIQDEQLAEIDPGLDQDPRDPLQQVNMTHAGALAELWELGQAVYNAAYPDSANDDSLDNVASITGTKRSATTKTTIKDVDVTLAPNASLPAGSVAHLASQPNARFVSVAEVPLSVPGGVFQVDFIAETAGATVVAPSQLDTIAEPVTGWLAVDNPNAGVTGTDTEDDPDLRIKRIDELQAAGSTNVNSIRADLLKVASVLAAVVFENDTDFVDGSGNAPHSIRAVLRGGAAADIATAIFDSKAAGIATNGAQVEIVDDSQSNPHTILFDYATELVFHADGEVVIDPNVFDAVQGPLDIDANVLAYINALDIGEDVIYDQVKCAVLDVAGVIKFNNLTIGFAPAPIGVVDLVVDEDEFASADAANVTVTTTP